MEIFGLLNYLMLLILCFIKCSCTSQFSFFALAYIYLVFQGSNLVILCLDISLVTEPDRWMIVKLDTHLTASGPVYECDSLWAW